MANVSTIRDEQKKRREERAAAEVRSRTPDIDGPKQKEPPVQQRRREQREAEAKAAEAKAKKAAAEREANAPIHTEHTTPRGANRPQRDVFGQPLVNPADEMRGPEKEAGPVHGPAKPPSNPYQVQETTGKKPVASQLRDAALGAKLQKSPEQRAGERAASVVMDGGINSAKKFIEGAELPGYTYDHASRPMTLEERKAERAAQLPLEERFPQLYDEFNELLQRGEDGRYGYSNPYRKMYTEEVEGGPAILHFDWFLEDSLGVDASDGISAEELGRARREAKIMDSREMDPEVAAKNVQTPVPTGEVDEERQEKLDRRRGAVRDNKPSMVDDKYFLPNSNTPDRLRPKNSLSFDPTGGAGGEGSFNPIGMSMGPDGMSEEATSQMMGRMQPGVWEGLSREEKEATVTYLAGQLGVDLSNEHPEDRYGAALRVVAQHLYDVGTPEQKIWANDVGRLGNSRDIMALHGRRAKSDPDYKARENFYNEVTGEWEIRQTQDSKDRAADRAAKIHAAKNIKGNYEDFLGDDGSVDDSKVEAAVIEAAGLADKPREEWTFEDETTFKRMMANVQGMDRQRRFDQQREDMGRGQLAMGSKGDHVGWRRQGEMLRRLDAAETDAEKAEILAQMGEDPTFYEDRAGAQLAAKTAAEVAAAGREKPNYDDMSPRAKVDDAVKGNSWVTALETTPSVGDPDDPDAATRKRRLVMSNYLNGEYGDERASLSPAQLEKDPFYNEWLQDILNGRRKEWSFLQPFIEDPNIANEEKFVEEALATLGVGTNHPHFKEWVGTMKREYQRKTGWRPAEGEGAEAPPPEDDTAAKINRVQSSRQKPGQRPSIGSAGSRGVAPPNVNVQY